MTDSALAASRATLGIRHEPWAVKAALRRQRRSVWAFYTPARTQVGLFNPPCLPAFGIKPTYGRVPAWPASLRTLSYRSNHPYRSRCRRNADDYGAADLRDWTALPPVDVDYLDDFEAGIKGLNAFSLTLGHVDFVHPDVAASVTAAANALPNLAQMWWKWTRISPTRRRSSVPTGLPSRSRR